MSMATSFRHVVAALGRVLCDKKVGRLRSLPVGAATANPMENPKMRHTMGKAIAKTSRTLIIDILLLPRNRKRVQEAEICSQKLLAKKSAIDK